MEEVGAVDVGNVVAGKVDWCFVCVGIWNYVIIGYLLLWVCGVRGEGNLGKDRQNVCFLIRWVEF